MSLRSSAEPAAACEFPRGGICADIFEIKITRIFTQYQFSPDEVSSIDIHFPSSENLCLVTASRCSDPEADGEKFHYAEGTHICPLVCSICVMTNAHFY